MSGKKTRYSVALFSHLKGIVEVPKELVDDEHPLQFNSFDNFGLLRFSLTQEAIKADNIIKAYCGAVWVHSSSIRSISITINIYIYLVNLYSLWWTFFSFPFPSLPFFLFPFFGFVWLFCLTLMVGYVWRSKNI